ncbi:hypothetical protein QUB60_20975 [Microcoleus sp. A2-C5]|uniref:hypothetical protein n=1 Tax=unclassified Microcoleus TaxID=2642155 RepID=UPI002FD57A45
MLNTAGLFEAKPLQGNVPSVLAEMPDLFGSKFDRLNRLSPNAAGDTNVLFNANYDLTQTPDLAADATGSAIDFFDQITKKRARRAPGFRHGEEVGSDFSRLEISFSKRIAIPIFLVNWTAIFMTNACYSPRLSYDVKTT